MQLQSRHLVEIETNPLDRVDLIIHQVLYTIDLTKAAFAE